MKRFLFVATLLLIVVSQNIFAESNENIEILKKGDLQYMVAYTDTLKQHVRDFWVWHLPEKNKELFKGVEMREDIPISILDKENINAVIEYLLIKHFGEGKAFDSEGRSNIYNITYLVHIHSRRVYFSNILFHRDAYNLITDEEILGFIEDFNHIKIKINNIEKYNENVYAIYNYGVFNKIFGIE